VTRVITFGTFDMFHVGHLSILERARALGDSLIVGVSTDTLTASKKGRSAIHSYEERARIIAALRCVDAVFPEESLEQKRDYVLRFSGDLLVMGDDWTGRFDSLRDIVQVVYLPRTPSISTTATIERIRLT
jgi:glycerol-3-phosphate cytidylyltransferase